MARVPSEDSDQPGHLPSLISLRLSTWRKLGSLATHWAHSEDSDQTGRMPRLISVFSGRSHFVGFVNYTSCLWAMSWEKGPNHWAMTGSSNTSACNHLVDPRMWILPKFSPNFINEPQKDKTNKMTCVSSEDSDQFSLCTHWVAIGPKVYADSNDW